MANAAEVITLKDQVVAFAILTGAGKKGKKPENEYVLAVEVTAKQRKQLIKELSEFFDEHKTAKAEKPAYEFEDWFTESKSVKGGFVFWGSELVISDITRKVAPGTGYSLREFGEMGAGSVVDVEYRFFYFNNSFGEGLGMRLSAVKLNKFTPYTGGGGATLDGDTLQGDGTQVESSASKEEDSGDEDVADFREAIEDKDWDEAKDILDDELADHPDHKKFKKELKKAKKA